MNLLIIKKEDPNYKQNYCGNYSIVFGEHFVKAKEKPIKVSAFYQLGKKK